MSLRVAVIGFGKTGRVHFEHLQALHGGQVVAVVDSRLPPLPERKPGVTYEEGWHRVVRDPGVDAVVICLPHLYHAPCAEEAIRQGKHVFLEKPIATTYPEASKLVNLAREYGVICMVNMTHRFYPPIQQARQWIREGKIGSVISVRDYYMEILDRSEFPGWFFDPVLAGGGVVITDSIHLIDRVEWLLGERLRFVAGTERRMEPDTGVEDCAEILCNTVSGIPVTIGSFFFKGPKAWEDGLTVFGTLGVLRVQAWSHAEYQRYGELEVCRFEGYPAEAPQGERSAFGHRNAIHEFVKAIEEKREPESSARSALNAQEIVEHFYCYTGNLSNAICDE